MDSLLLYLRYAVRSFLRGRSRSFFGAFCVAAGVAGVVALQTVSANFHDAVSTSSQRTNRGDLSVDATGPDLRGAQIALFAHLRRAGAITAYTLVLDRTANVHKANGDAALTSLSAVSAIDPHVYPFYDRIVAENPAGWPLSRVLAAPNDAGVSADIFDHLHLTLGDRLILIERSTSYIVRVRAVLPENAEPFGSTFLGASDFVFVNYALFNPSPGAGAVASHIYGTTRTAAQAETAKRQIKTALGPLADVNTAADVLAQAADASRQLSSFLTIMGLVALLIGGIGVVNTMLVSVRRRIREIAVLKALGMKGWQVISVFLLEALVLGGLGSAAGAILGLGASLLVNNVAQSLVGAVLVWHLQLLPIVMGGVVGILASAIFAFLPVLGASDTRPLAVLSEDAALLPRAPRGRTLLALLVLTAIMGIVSSYLIDLQTPWHPIVVGLVLGYGVLLVVGAFMVVLLGVVWLLSRLPGLGLFTLRLALRNMERQRRRLAATLLALSIGILAVGAVAIVSGNIKEAIATAYSTQLHANVLLFSPISVDNEALLRRTLRRLPGVESVEQGVVAANTQLTAVNGVSLATLLRQHARSSSGSRVGSLINGVFGRDLRVARFGDKLSAGRLLTVGDRGTHNCVILGSLADPLGIHVGDSLTYSSDAGPIQLHVVGIIKRKSVSFTFGTTVDTDVARQFTGGLSSLFGAPNYDATYLQIADHALTADVATLRRALPHTFTLDLSALIPEISRLIDRFALFPEIIAALALFAGAVIIANSVALAVLERQREIAIMKAIGASGGTVLRVFLLESAIIGLVGGILGVLVAVLIVVVLDNTVLNIAPSINVFVALALVALGVVLALGASLLSAWPAAREKPLVVLRYE